MELRSKLNNILDPNRFNLLGLKPAYSTSIVPLASENSIDDDEPISNDYRNYIYTSKVTKHIPSGLSSNENINELSSNKGSKECANPECLGILDEISSLEDDFSNLNNKKEILDYNKAQQLIEINDKILDMNYKTEELIESYSFFTGESIPNLNYFELTRLEKSTLQLLMRVKKRISQIELKYIKEEVDLEHNSICLICKTNKINTIILPCNHACYCYECSVTIDVCSECSSEIDSREKVFLNIETVT